jgi:Cu2+-containing amine oxidase
LCWQVLNGPNLVITGAWYRPAPNAAWIKILYDGRLSQLFVPYHSGSPRFYDVDYGFPHVQLSKDDCVPPGKILGTQSEVCKEVRDRGLMWKHKLKERRGQELALWSVLAAGNYDYIVEWIFRDDGVFGMRLGMTGIIWANLQTHVHGTIWRLDIDLNGACCDTAAIMSHQEVGITGLDSMNDVNNAAGFPWNDVGYDMLSIRDATLKNPKGKATEWHLIPYRTGTPMHQEGFTKNTYWVTPYVWSQTRAEQLPSYVEGRPNTKNTDVVLWYYTGVHHMIRDEDLKPNWFAGMTLTMYDYFQLKPFNLWGQTPFCDPPSQCE